MELNMLAHAVSTLDDVADEIAATEGVNLADLEPLTTLVVRTCHSLYRIIVWRDTTVLVQGGRHFPDTVFGRINGSSLRGSPLKLGWIGVGLRMEICADGRLIVTSPVQEITTERHRSMDRPQ